MRIQFLGFAAAAMLLFVSATDWDGAAVIDTSGRLSGTEYSIATNAFPKNTVVDVTNLENYQTVRVIVESDLSTAGLLASLSSRAAEAIGIRGNSVYRIRISQPPDEVAFSHLRQNGSAPSWEAASPSPEGTDPALHPSENEAPAPQEYATTSEDSVFAVQPSETEETVPAEQFSVQEAIAETDETEQFSEQEAIAETDEIEDSDTFYADAPVETSFNDPQPLAEAEIVTESAELSLVPSEERIPEGTEREISPDDFVPPIEPREYEFVAGIPPKESPAAEVSEFSPFSAPLISSLESNRWYVQVAAYSRHDYVENEISRLGTEYPLAIQNIGTDINPMFRVLLGPLNQGEGGAMLQRMKSIGYRDAFIRKN